MFKSTRKEARACGDLYYFTGVACKHGHINKRFVSCGVCLGCYRIHRENNRENEVIRVTEYNKNNLDKMKCRQIKYRASIKGRGVANASSAKRRVSKIQRTSKWLSKNDLKMIDNMYLIASRVSKETGVKHHVDHVVPLQGELVSGLHVPNNLQLLTAFDNTSKGNNYVECI